MRIDCETVPTAAETTSSAQLLSALLVAPQHAKDLRLIEQQKEMSQQLSRMLLASRKFRNHGMARRQDIIVAVPGFKITRKPFRFMDLPVELRVRVYDYCVPPGKVFVRLGSQATCQDLRFDDYIEGWRPWPAKADTQLFLVSRTVG